MRPAQWTILLGSLGALASLLALLSISGRAYLRGQVEESGRRSRPLGIFALSIGFVSLAGLAGLVRSAPRPSLFLAGLLAAGAAALAAGLGGLSRKPVPSVYVAWAAYAGAVLLIAASFSC